jgi:predicted Zn-dependent protease
MLLLGVVQTCGCAPKFKPIGPGYVYEPGERERRLWETTRENEAAIENGGAVYRDVRLQTYVQSVLDRVLGHNESAYLPLKPRVVIIDSPTLNAFSLSHGDICIHTGIIGRMRNEAQLAMLLGHEFTHATHRHLYQEYEHAYASTGTYSYISVLSVIGGNNVHNMMEGVSRVILIAAISGYSREKEEESDQIGLTLMAQAGYDPREGAKMFEAMLEATDKKDRTYNFFYSDHPKMESRVRSSTSLVKRLPPELISQATDIGQDRFLDNALKLIYAEVERHITQGKFSLAEKTLTFLAGARPNNGATFALSGDLYRARATSGDEQRSKEAYARALTIDKTCANAHKGLGYVLAKEGDKAQAAEHLNSFLQLSPSAPDVPYVQQYVKRLMTDK